MPDVLGAESQPAPDAPPRTRPDERAARRSMLDQIERLEAELASLFCSTWPRKGFEWGCRAAPARACCRSGSSRSCATTWPTAWPDGRAALSDRTYAEEQNRRLIEEMLLDPEAHKWRRVSHEDIGEPGCRHWHVRPRMGLLGHARGLVAGRDLLRLSVSHLTPDGTA